MMLYSPQRTREGYLLSDKGATFSAIRERRQNILGPVSRLVLLRGGGGISKSAKVEAGGPKISQLIKLY